MLRFITATSILAICCHSMAQVPAQIARPAQTARNAAPVQAEAAGRAQINPETPSGNGADQALPAELQRLLEAWAIASAKIERLEGEHFRRVYDYAFAVEKVSQGKFYFQSPDKGRIDVTEPESRQMQQLQTAREAGEIAAPRDTNGNIFQLKTDTPEQWICDGLRVFEMNVLEKRVEIMQLPPQLQGTNIMDSPLPFLFGMPPERARQRFQLRFAQPFDPARGYAMITAEPRLSQDAKNWQKADVKLNLKTFLPEAVRLTDPTGEQITTYTFTNMEVNKSTWLRLIPGLAPEDIFKPDLRGWQIVKVGSEPQSPSIIPNLVGQPYKNAVLELQKLGLNADEKAGEKTILLAPGPPATRADDVFRVESQDPRAGTPITPDTTVKLVLWNKTSTN